MVAETAQLTIPFFLADRQISKRTTSLQSWEEQTEVMYTKQILEL